MLGREAVFALRRAGWSVTDFSRSAFDLAHPITLPSTDIIVNCAAYTNVEQAEREPEIAARVNGHAVGDLGLQARRLGAYLIHISTDFVFNGRVTRPHREDDVPDPLNAYGKSKLLGERLFQESGAMGCIARVQWSYGAGGNHFVEKIAQLARERTHIRVVTDQHGTPSWTRVLASALPILAKERPDGVVHLAPNGSASRYAVAQRVVERLGLPTTIEPCVSADFPGVPRPAASTFCTDRARGLGIDLGAWEAALDAYLQEHQNRGDE